MAEEKGDVSQLEMYLRELEELRSEKQELEGYLRNRFVKEFAEIHGIEQSIESARLRMDEVLARMREVDPQVFDDLSTAKREISNKEAQVKSFVYSLPAAQLKKAQSFSAHGLKVGVSKATIRREYKPDLLKKHPELENMFVDGDPVVVRSIDTAVLDRLVAEGKFDADEAKAFLLETKIRNPQVRIRTADEEDEDEPEDR